MSLFWFVGRTVVGPTTWMNACCRDRRKLKLECTDRIGNRELDHGGICRRGGRSCRSPGPLHSTSVTADARFPTRKIGKVVAVPAFCRPDSADRKLEARCSSRYACVWARVPEYEQRPRWGIDGWSAVVGAEGWGKRWIWNRGDGFEIKEEEYHRKVRGKREMGREAGKRIH